MGAPQRPERRTFQPLPSAAFRLAGPSVVRVTRQRPKPTPRRKPEVIAARPSGRGRQAPVPTPAAGATAPRAPLVEIGLPSRVRTARPTLQAAKAGRPARQVEGPRRPRRNAVPRVGQIKPPARLAGLKPEEAARTRAVPGAKAGGEPRPLPVAPVTTTAAPTPTTLRPSPLAARPEERPRVRRAGLLPAVVRPAILQPILPAPASQRPQPTKTTQPS